MTDLASIADALEQHLPDRVPRDAPGGALTTYRCGGTLAVLVRVDDERDLAFVSEVVGPSGARVLVVGRGSNLLIADDGFAGVALVLGAGFEGLAIDSERAVVEAGGAVALPVLARRAAAAGITGLEFYVGIPGSVGGAVKMNAGGHGSQTNDVITGARVFDLDAGHAADLAASALGLGYRTSALSERAIVTAATVRGAPDATAACAARIDDIVRWRREHQPGGQNAGSVFTNPPGDAAGRIIDATGCKGLRIGGAVVSEKHANFFVAEAGATAADVYALVREVRRRVADATGVVLEPELRFVGFPPCRPERAS
jgi:UDP-N-acetylmuramate dehydrogenase